MTATWKHIALKDRIHELAVEALDEISLLHHRRNLEGAYEVAFLSIRGIAELTDTTEPKDDQQ